MQPIESIVDDKLDGVPAIAQFIDEPERRTRYLIQRGLIPAGKLYWSSPPPSNRSSSWTSAS